MCAQTHEPGFVSDQLNPHYFRHLAVLFDQSPFAAPNLTVAGRHTMSALLCVQYLSDTC
jgi:hypothetical protein